MPFPPGVDLSSFVFDGTDGSGQALFDNGALNEEGYTFASNLPSATSSFVTLVEPDSEPSVFQDVLGDAQCLLPVQGLPQHNEAQRGQGLQELSQGQAQYTQAWTSTGIPWSAGMAQQCMPSFGDAGQSMAQAYSNASTESGPWAMMQPAQTSSQQNLWDLQQSFEQYSYASDLPAYSSDDRGAGSNLFVNLDGQLVGISSNPPEYQENAAAQAQAADVPLPPYVSLRVDAHQPAPAYSIGPSRSYKSSMGGQMAFDQSILSNPSSFTSSLADAMKMPAIDFPSTSSIPSKRRKPSHQPTWNAHPNTLIQATL